MRAASRAFLLQWDLSLRTPNYWMALVTSVPQTLIFLSVVDSFDRPDLMVNALLAPMLISMWGVSLWTGGGVMRDDRWQGRIEVHLATPASYGLVVVARVAAVIALSLLAVPLVLVTAALTYGVDIRVEHPWLLMVAFLVTAAAMVGTGLIFSSMTLISRAAITFQSAASYPFLLVGGVFVPLDLMPAWVQPLGRVVFLSWSADLIRDAVSAPVVADPWLRLAVIAGLGVAGMVIGQWLVRVIIDRVRVSGELASI